MEGKVNSRKDCSFILEWEREAKGHREVEDARERKQKEQSPRGRKGQGQEQVEILALDRGREALLLKSGEGRSDECRYRWGARIVGGRWVSSFLRTSLFFVN